MNGSDSQIPAGEQFRLPGGRGDSLEPSFGRSVQ